MDINQRFAALPRARRGDTTVIIADEAVLAALIGDAQASEAALSRGPWWSRGNRDYLIHGQPPTEKPIRMVITDAPAPPPQIVFVDRPRHGPGRRW